MIRSVTARDANGVLTPLEPLRLEEGAEGTVSIGGGSSGEQGTAALRLIDDLRAAVPEHGPADLPADMAKNYKHHLYGHPKDGNRRAMCSPASGTADSRDQLHGRARAINGGRTGS